MPSQERPRNNVALKAAQLNKCLITAAALLQSKSAYFATNFELSSLVESLRGPVAQAELVKLKMKALPEPIDQVEQAEPDNDEVWS